MITTDCIMIGLIVIVGALGALLGFGKGIKILTGGIVGILISIVNCYFLFGLISNLGFVKSFMNLIVEGLTNANHFFCDFLLTIRIEMITVAVILFILVTLVRKIIVAVIANIAEADHKVFKVINKVLGTLLSIAAFVIVFLIVLQIGYMISGANGSFAVCFKNSFFRLDEVYLHNPLSSIFERFIRK